jgi:hypothetical protein
MLAIQVGFAIQHMMARPFPRTRSSAVPVFLSVVEPECRIRGRIISTSTASTTFS